MAYRHTKEWRAKNPEARSAEKKRNYAQTGGREKNRNWYQRYTPREDKLILIAELLDRELHKLLGRSVQGIQKRRCILKEGLLRKQNGLKEILNNYYRLA